LVKLQMAIEEMDGLTVLLQAKVETEEVSLLKWMPGVGVIKASKRSLLIEFSVMRNLGKQVPYKFPTQRSASL